MQVDTCRSVTITPGWDVACALRKLPESLQPKNLIPGGCLRAFFGGSVLWACSSKIRSWRFGPEAGRSRFAPRFVLGLEAQLERPRRRQAGVRGFAALKRSRFILLPLYPGVSPFSRRRVCWNAENPQNARGAKAHRRSLAPSASCLRLESNSLSAASPVKAPACDPAGASFVQSGFMG